MTGILNFLGTVSLEGADDLAKLMNDISEIVTGILMPIIYAVLGIFLVVKGAILGMQIVKAADEPQVRQEKIGSLKWLIIGIAIAYGVAAIAHIVLNTFKTTAGNLGTTGAGGEGS